jgi:putative membrane protein insertion efficiency factor
VSFKKSVKAALMGFRHLTHLVVGGTGCCQFVPSCSEYCMEAIEKHGVFCGLELFIKRLLKCHPWGKGGLDLVPQIRGVLEDHNGC